MNADRQLNSGLIGINLFVYCSNNCVNYFDPTGHEGDGLALSKAWGSMEEPLISIGPEGAVGFTIGEVVFCLIDLFTYIPQAVDYLAYSCDKLGDSLGNNNYSDGSGNSGAPDPNDPNDWRNKNHEHHTIPREIQRRLPAHIRNHPDIIGRKGLPNKTLVNAFKHLNTIHKGSRGGTYNQRFIQEIFNRGGFDQVTVSDVLEIRDMLVNEFNIIM